MILWKSYLKLIFHIYIIDKKLLDALVNKKIGPVPINDMQTRPPPPPLSKVVKLWFFFKKGCANLRVFN